VTNTGQVSIVGGKIALYPTTGNSTSTPLFFVDSSGGGTMEINMKNGSINLGNEAFYVNDEGVLTANLGYIAGINITSG